VNDNQQGVTTIKVKGGKRVMAAIYAVVDWLLERLLVFIPHHLSRLLFFLFDDVSSCR
jgi:hypothetical protein